MNELSIFEKQDTDLSLEEIKFINLHKRCVQSELMIIMHTYDLANSLKRIYDEKLYEIAGFKKLEDYTESKLNMKKTYAYNLIQIANTYSKEFFDLVGNVEISKLIAMLKLGEEGAYSFIEENDIENITVKDLKEKIKQLTNEKDSLSSKIENLESDLESEKQDYNELMERSKEYFNGYEESQNKIKQLQLDIDKMQNNTNAEVVEIIKEVPIEDTSKIDDLVHQKEKLELEKKSLQEQLEKAKKTKANSKELKEELELVKNEKDNLIKEIEELNKKIKLSSNEDFNKFKIQFSLLQTTLEKTLDMISSFSDKEFQIKCYSALNKLLEGVGKND